MNSYYSVNAPCIYIVCAYVLFSSDANFNVTNINLKEKQTKQKENKKSNTTACNDTYIEKHNDTYSHSFYIKCFIYFIQHTRTIIPKTKISHITSI